MGIESHELPDDYRWEKMNSAELEAESQKEQIMSAIKEDLELMLPSGGVDLKIGVEYGDGNQKQYKILIFVEDSSRYEKPFTREIYVNKDSYKDIPKFRKRFRVITSMLRDEMLAVRDDDGVTRERIPASLPDVPAYREAAREIYEETHDALEDLRAETYKGAILKDRSRKLAKVLGVDRDDLEDIIDVESVKQKLHDEDPDGLVQTFLKITWRDGMRPVSVKIDPNASKIQDELAKVYRKIDRRLQEIVNATSTPKTKKEKRQAARKKREDREVKRAKNAELKLEREKELNLENTGKAEANEERIKRLGDEYVAKEKAYKKEKREEKKAARKRRRKNKEKSPKQLERELAKKRKQAEKDERKAILDRYK
jgi:hypothetical protein